MERKRSGPAGNSFRRPQSTHKATASLARIWYGLRAVYRKARISRPVTRILGTQYKRSRSMIEVDITYMCNLRCANCNRSCAQAPEAMHIQVDAIRDFVDESLRRDHQWTRIRILGGEPTLHPQFFEIVDHLLRYRRWNPTCTFEVVTNGHGERVKTVLNRLPEWVWIENSSKEGSIQPEFAPFNMAPVDDHAFRGAIFENGCAIMEECGMGLTPLGYYPCAIAGGIDRIAGLKLGYPSLPQRDDDMRGLLKPFCSLCGRFRDGHYVPKNLRRPLTTAMISETWRLLYEKRISNGPGSI